MQGFLESSYRIRFGDCDPFRHLNNARFIDYFLNAREDHVRDHYSMDLADYYKKGIGWVVSEHQIRFVRPAAFNELVHIGSALIGADEEHLEVEMVMMNEKRQHLKALLHTTFVPINLTTGKKEKHPQEFMDFIADKIIQEGYIKQELAERVEFLQQHFMQVH